MSTTALPTRKCTGFALGPTTSRGAVLLVSLIFLLLITILALSASKTSLMQEKMVGATRNAQLATFGAESALRQAEARLWQASASGTPFIACGGAGLFECYAFKATDPVSAVVNFRTEEGWVTTGAVAYASDMTSLPTGSETAELAQTPRYIIEDMGIERPPGAGTAIEYNSGSSTLGVDKHLFRITARSTGGNDKVVRVVQTTFAAKAN